MNKHLLAALALVMAGTGGAAAGSFADGYAAHRAGDYAEALRIWTPLAEAGDALAQFNLGIMHTHGRSIGRDHAAAAYWFERSAEQGDPVAAYNLGLIYSEGRGVEQDYETAVHWLAQASSQGHVTAMSRLATHYANGRGVTQDLMRALELSEIARQTECILDDMDQNHQVRMKPVSLLGLGG